MTDLMNDDELESMLRSVPLHKPSREMDDRVMHELAEAASPGPYRLWWRVGSALAACAAIVALVLMVISSNRQKAPGTGPIAKGVQPGAEIEFNPVRIEDRWSSLQPQGVIQVDDTPVRQYLQQSYERVQLIDEERNIRIEYTVPRHDLIMTPARFE